MHYIVTSTVIQAGELIHNFQSECQPQELANEILRHISLRDDEGLESLTVIRAEGGE